MKYKTKQKIVINKLVFFVLYIFLGGIINIILNFSTFANNSVQIVFEECVQNICQKISNENKNYILYPSLKSGEKVKLGISVLNPQKKSLYSVESWLRFDPQKITVSHLSSENSDFSLEAPGEFEIDNKSGIIKIGRAVAGAPASKTRNFIASFEITAKRNTQSSLLSFVDYRASDVGKTSVLTIENMIPQNILFSKPKNLMFSSFTMHNSPNQYTIPNTVKYIQNGNNVYGVQNHNISQNSNSSYIPSFIDIPRPTGLRTRTYLDGRVDHIWKFGSDPRIFGYYLYYSTTSGKYMHRKDLGKSNAYRFPAGFFEKGKRVYFAVQAYDKNRKTSDFSDETYVTVGTEGSESHPFFEQIFPNVQLNSQGKAYKNTSGQLIPQNSQKYSANLSHKYPKKNIKSGNSENIIFIILGLGITTLGIRKFYT